jgi:hypothetical protein
VGTHGGRRAGAARAGQPEGAAPARQPLRAGTALIERWLAAVERGTREHWALGHELALCGRLIKGYGSTNERGKANLLHMIEHLA